MLPKNACWLELETLLKKEVLIIDGAMGTMVQLYKLQEADFRKGHFENHSKELRGNNDLLCLTRPDVIKNIHLEYLRAGAHIIETNTFGATRIAQADYELSDKAKAINHAAVRVARDAVTEYQKENPQARCFVAGAMGPTNKLIFSIFGFSMTALDLAATSHKIESGLQYKKKGFL